MSYDFKKINELELVNEVPEGANVLIETEGATKRLPGTAINNGYSKDEVYTKVETDGKYAVKENVYNKEEADDKFLTRETIAKPNLSQNDPNAPDFVKGRTHYEIDEYGFVAKEQTVRQTEEFGVAQLVIKSALIYEGETYIVTLNGTRYECVAWWNDNWQAMMLGNGLLAEKEGMGEDVPFAFDFYAEDDVAWYCFAEDGEYVLSIEGMMSGVKKLDPKYLPDNIGGGETITFVQKFDGSYKTFVNGAAPDREQCIEWAKKRVPVAAVDCGTGEYPRTISAGSATWDLMARETSDGDILCDISVTYLLNSQVHSLKVADVSLDEFNEIQEAWAS